MSPDKDSTPLDKQIRDYLQILKQDPRSRVFAPLAELLLKVNKSSAAQNVCQMGLKANPGFSDGYLVYARVLIGMKHLHEAIKAIEKALELNPDSADAYALAARMYHEQGQDKAALQACMKAIDLDPGCRDAREILKEIGRANLAASGAQPVEQVRSSTREFRAIAGTAPSKRLTEKPPSPASLFGNELSDASQDAIDRVDTADQPFAAISSGSQPPPAQPEPDESFEVPTRPEKSNAVKARPPTPVPKLPPRPDEAATPAEPGPLPEAKPAPAAARVAQTTGGQPAAGNLQRVENVQAVIDSYVADIPTLEDDEVPLKVPRSGRLKFLLGLVFVLAALVGLFVVGTRTKKDTGAERPDGGQPFPASMAPETVDSAVPPAVPDAGGTRVAPGEGIAESTDAGTTQADAGVTDGSGESVTPAPADRDSTDLSAGDEGQDSQQKADKPKKKKASRAVRRKRRRRRKKRKRPRRKKRKKRRRKRR